MPPDDPMRVDALTDAALAARDEGGDPLTALLEEVVATAHRSGDDSLFARADSSATTMRRYDGPRVDR